MKEEVSSILVTGGTGLVGSYLLKELIKGNAHIKALYRKAIPEIFTNEDNEKIEWIKGDVLDVPVLFDSMQGVDQVYHAAAIVTFNPKRKKELFRINIEGTANVVNAAIESGVKKMVHVSSVSAMGRIRKNVEIDETMFWTEETSNSNYGKSKYLSEMEVWRGIAEGLQAVIVNPTVILGAGDWEGGSSKIFKSAYENFPWYTEGAGGFVDVRDVVRSMIMLMESSITAERFVISAENKTYREIFTTIANEFG
ncbi:MAG TPA: NAD-dependent epimerase/dehydratase family protein, partial [Chitinophagaceae bacterium]|nr:NAD-dependent epimerase/dehydratase family protein [Chitinophagaceae bacterium]